METLAYILVMGVDSTPAGNTRLVAQVGLPSTEPANGGEGPVISTLVAEGRDMTEAMDNLFLQSTKRPNLNHLRLVVFSEKLAREGVEPYLDFLRRTTSVRLNIKVAVSRDDTEKLLALEEPLSTQPALAIVNQFSYNAERSSVVQVELMDLVSQLLEPDRQFALPLVESGEDMFSLGKTAVFQGDKMVGTLDRNQTFGLLLWRNRVRGGVFTLPQNQEDVASFRIITSASEVSTHWDGEILHVQIKTNTVVDINEVHGPDQEALESIVSNFINNQLKSVLSVARDSETDFLNIAVVMRRSNPQAWAAQKDRWADVLREAQYSYESRAHIRGQGQVR